MAAVPRDSRGPDLSTPQEPQGRNDRVQSNLTIRVFWHECWLACTGDYSNAQDLPEELRYVKIPLCAGLAALQLADLRT
jgi:hypothetical protein